MLNTYEKREQSYKDLINCDSHEAGLMMATAQLS